MLTWLWFVVFQISLVAFLTIRKIELKAEDLYDKEKVDLETIVIDDVFKLLQCDESGLSAEEARRRIELFGPNKLEQEEQNAFLQVTTRHILLHALKNCICSVLEFHVESFVLGHGGCCPRGDRALQR